MKENVTLVKEKISADTQHWLVAILFSSFLTRIIYIGMKMPLWWDSHVYIGMGKYMFSAGKLGIWEMFRPLIHPFILGLSWWLGFQPLDAGKLLDVVFSLIAIWLVFLIGNEVWGKRVGLVSAALFSFTGLFMMFSGLVLTEPLGLVFMLFGVWLFFKERWFSAGLMFGMSFLTKFPFGLIVLALGVTLGSSIIWNRSIWKTEVNRASMIFFKVGSGFGIIALPYFILNYFLYGNALLPLLEGSAIISTYTWLYGGGWSFYFREFFASNIIYLLIIPFGYYFITRKLYLNPQIRLLFFGFLIFFLYFEYVPRKELRYLVLGLPLLAIMVAYVIIEWYDHLRRTSHPIIKPNAFVFLCVVIVGASLPLPITFERPPSFEIPIIDLTQAYNLSGLVLTTDPAPVSFLDNRIETLDGILYAPWIYEKYKQDYDLLYVNTCDLSCPLQNETCQRVQDDFIEKIQTENVLNDTKTFKNCTYYLFIPERISYANTYANDIEDSTLESKNISGNIQ